MSQAPTQGCDFEIKGLKKAFDGHVVLDGIDLKVNIGEIVAIVGGSGCGKTVLLNLMLGQMKPDAGSVRVANHEQAQAPLVDIHKIDERELDAVHTHWGVVFQNNALFSGTVYDNLSLWLDEIKNMDPEAIRLIAVGALDAVSLPSTDEFMEHSIDSLSGGMAKRLAVARAVAMDPEVIFYDEPTTGLDPTSAMQIQDLIVATHRVGNDASVGTTTERTTIIITHDKDLLKRLSPRIVMLYDGKVYYDGDLEGFEKSTSQYIRPYFDLMPALQKRTA